MLLSVTGQEVGAVVDGRHLCATCVTPPVGTSVVVLAGTLEHMAEMIRWGRLQPITRETAAGQRCETCGARIG
jgi:hypothetical protein